MKKLDELGISPTPWHNEDDYIVADDGTPIARMVTGGRYDADTRMVKAAPTMYDQLLKDLDIFETILKTVEAKSFTEEAFILSVRYRVSAIKYTLEKAGGESEVGK